MISLPNIVNIVTNFACRWYGIVEKVLSPSAWIQLNVNSCNEMPSMNSMSSMSSFKPWTFVIQWCFPVWIDIDDEDDEGSCGMVTNGQCGAEDDKSLQTAQLALHFPCTLHIVHCSRVWCTLHTAHNCIIVLHTAQTSMHLVLGGNYNSHLPFIWLFLPMHTERYK